MQENDPVPETEMIRVPGFYRRWELPELLKNHHAFRIEDAGAHQDGTPLLAIYAASDSDPRIADDAVGPGSGRRSRATGTVPRRPE